MSYSSTNREHQQTGLRQCITLDGNEGAGKSTIVALLSDFLNLEKVSGGNIRRSMAVHWANRLAANRPTTKAEKKAAWDNFVQTYVNIQKNHNWEFHDHLMKENPAADCSEECLRRFNRANEYYRSHDMGYQQTVFDRLLDERIHAELAVHGGITDARIGQYLEAIFGEIPAHVTLHFFLDVDPVEGARRIEQREIKKGKLKARKWYRPQTWGQQSRIRRKTAHRNESDAQRYEALYHLSEIQLGEEHRLHPIDTTYLTPDEVFGQIIAIVYGHLNAWLITAHTTTDEKAFEEALALITKIQEYPPFQSQTHLSSTPAVELTQQAIATA